MLAAAFARLLSRADRKPLPALDTSHDEAWDCHVRNWRPGKPHRETWDNFHAQARPGDGLMFFLLNPRLLVGIALMAALALSQCPRRLRRLHPSGASREIALAGRGTILAMNSTRAQRLGHLEGLRGVAALAVMLGHLLGAFWPTIVFGSPETAHHALEMAMFDAPGFVHALYNGGFAVLIFFVLSGYVLTYRSASEGVLERMAVRRFPRLAIPSFASVLLGYLLLQCGLMFNQQAAPVTKSAWLGGFYNFPADIWGALAQGAVGVTLFGQASYNPALWTITIEFYGALLVLGMSLLFRPFGPWRLPFFAVAAALAVWNFGTTGVYYAALIAGMVLATTRRDSRSWPSWAALAVVALALYLGGANEGRSFSWLGASTLKLNGMDVNKVVAVKCVAAILLTCALLRHGGLQRMLSTAPCRYLGRLSFSLYLLHLPLICSVGCWIFLSIHAGANYNLAALIAAVATMAVVFALAHLFERFVDRGAISLARTFSDALTRQPASSQPRALSQV